MDQALATICPPAVDGLLRAVDWARSPLGPVEAWPAPLRFTVDLMTHSESSMFLVWGEQRIFLYNEAYLPVLGNKHPRALGRPMVDSWSEVWDEVSVLLQRTFDGESLRFENHPFLIHRDGREEQAWFDFSYTPIYGAAQQVLGVLCILSEKTGQVLAERALKQQADMLQQLFADAPGFMALLRGPQHVFELANHSYRELIGGRDPLRQRLRDALPEIVDQGFPELLDRVYHTGEPFFGRRVPVTLQRGGQRDLEQRWVDFMYQPVFDNEGRVNGVFVQGTDVTHHVHTEQELQQAAQRAAEERDRKDEFLAMLAHELRNPLAPIRAATDLLHLGQPDPARHARAVAVIDRQVRHMTTLVDDLLDVSRVTRGLVELDLRPTDLKTVIAAALEQARPLIEARGHALHVHTDAAHAMVRGDAPRLIQIVVNLLSNAAKYTPQGGRIDVSVAPQDEQLRITVQDNGSGISPELLPQVFEMFKQAVRTPDRSEGGLGIGLTLVRSLVAAHGGSVAAHSDGPGKGSCFDVLLPAHHEPAPARADATASSDAPAIETARRILIVDDNADAAETLGQLLEVLGHQVQISFDGRRAIEMAAAFQPDIFILDVGLPDMNGYELARRLGDIVPPDSALFVALTGYGQEHDRVLSRAAGFDHHLVKPVDLSLLCEVLNSNRA